MIRRTPAQGVRTWPQPDPSAAETAPIPGDLDVEVLEQQPDGWAHVRCSNGWEAWVDGRLLEDPSSIPAHEASGGTAGAGRVWTVAGIVIAAIVIGVLAVTQLGGDGDDTLAISANEPEADTNDAPETDTDTPEEESGETAGRDASNDLATLFDLDPSAVEDAPPPSTPAELIGGPADLVAAGVLRQDLGRAGHDLTGMGIDVLPIAGTDGSLLALSVDDSTVLVAGSSGGEESAVAEQLLLDIVGTIDARQLDVTQVAFNYSGADDQGPLVFTATFSLADIKGVVAGQQLAEDVIKVQVARGAGG